MTDHENKNTLPERIATTCAYHVQSTWDIVLDGISMTLSLMIVGTWNAYLYGMFTRHVAGAVPGAGRKDSLTFALGVTGVGILMFGVLGSLTSYKITPKRLSGNSLTNPFV